MESLSSNDSYFCKGPNQSSIVKSLKKVFLFFKCVFEGKPLGHPKNTFITCGTLLLSLKKKKAVKKKDHMALP
jgi:hypothetical protein